MPLVTQCWGAPTRIPSNMIRPTPEYERSLQLNTSLFIRADQSRQGLYAVGQAGPGGAVAQSRNVEGRSRCGYLLLVCGSTVSDRPSCGRRTDSTPSRQNGASGQGCSRIAAEDRRAGERTQRFSKESEMTRLPRVVTSLVSCYSHASMPKMRSRPSGRRRGPRAGSVRPLRRTSYQPGSR